MYSTFSTKFEVGLDYDGKVNLAVGNNKQQSCVFPYIKSMGSNKQALIDACRQIVDDDPKLMAELSLLFQFTLER